MEQGLLMSCLALFVNKTDCVNTNVNNAERYNEEEKMDNTEEIKLPF